MRHILLIVCLCLFAVCFSAVVSAQPSEPDVRAYSATKTVVPPVIDGVVSPGEWEAADAAAGDFRLLRTPAPGALAEENARFRIVWDDEYLFVLLESDRPEWAPPGDRPISFTTNDFNTNWYFDPDLDGNGNVNPPTGYQIAYSQRAGESSICDGERSNLGVFFEAHVNDRFGNQGNWFPAGQGLKVMQRLDDFGGVTEMKIPWTIWNAAGPNPETSGLFHPFAPEDGDVWFFNLGLLRAGVSGIQSLPIWNYNASQFFVDRPDGTLSFHVPEAAEQIQQLANFVAHLDLPEGTATSLHAMLAAARGPLTDSSPTNDVVGINVLAALAHAVRGQEMGSRIPAADAAVLQSSLEKTIHAWASTDGRGLGGRRRPFLRGDANSDDALDIADAVFALSYLFIGDRESLCDDATDANDDGEIDISDSLYVLRHLFVDTSPLPIPYPFLGFDPTVDALGCES